MFRSDTGVHKAFLLLLVLVFGLTSSAAFAQSNDDENFDDLRQQLKHEYFSVGSLLQTVANFPFSPSPGNHSGFSVANARVQVYGELDGKFGYQLQANAIKSPAVLDANVYYNFTPALTLKAGLFKSPFSGEYLTGAASIDFVNRSAAVNQLAPKRQIGLQLGGTFSDGLFRYKVGMFNGNGFDINENRDNNFLYVGRLESHINTGESSDNQLVMGVNVSYEQKDYYQGGSVRGRFQGEQFLSGVDGRLTIDDFMLNGEFLYSNMTDDFGNDINPYGYYLTAGYFVHPQTQLLLRWDKFDTDYSNYSENNTESIVAGLNYFPTTYSEIQLNYELPVDRDIEFSRVLLNLQINF